MVYMQILVNHAGHIQHPWIWLIHCTQSFMPLHQLLCYVMLNSMQLMIDVSFFKNSYLQFSLQLRRCLENKLYILYIYIYFPWWPSKKISLLAQTLQARQPTTCQHLSKRLNLKLPWTTFIPPEGAETPPCVTTNLLVYTFPALVIKCTIPIRSSKHYTDRTMIIRVINRFLRETDTHQISVWILSVIYKEGTTSVIIWLSAINQTPNIWLQIKRKKITHKEIKHD